MRIRTSGLSGAITAAINGSDTAIASAGFAALPVVASPNYLDLILDPDQIDGAPEIVRVTAHGAADTTVTATRGVQTAYAGSIAGRSHDADMTWNQGPTPGDFEQDYDGGAHTDSADALVLTSVLAVELNANIAAIASTTRISTCDLLFIQGATGGAWVTNTGITIAWAAGVAPTLSTVAGEVDHIRLVRASPDGVAWVGSVVGTGMTF